MAATRKGKGMIVPSMANADGKKSPPANLPVRSEIRVEAAKEFDRRLAVRIERLEAEERLAVLRRDWATATSKVLDKASLRKLRHPTIARNRS